MKRCPLVLWLTMIRLVFGSVVAIAQKPVVVATLVFDGVTVIDVEHGSHIPAQRVVIVGNRIKAIGGVNLGESTRFLYRRGHGSSTPRASI
jgi:hypothetical protein